MLEVCLPLLLRKLTIFHPGFGSGYPSSTPYFLVLTSHRRFSSYSGQVECLKFVVISSYEAAIFHPCFRSGYPSSIPYFLVLTSHRRFSSYSWAAEVLEVCLPLLPKKTAICHPRFTSGDPFSTPYLAGPNISPWFQLLFLGRRRA